MGTPAAPQRSGSLSSESFSPQAPLAEGWQHTLVRATFSMKLYPKLVNKKLHWTAGKIGSFRPRPNAPLTPFPTSTSKGWLRATLGHGSCWWTHLRWGNAVGRAGDWEGLLGAKITTCILIVFLNTTSLWSHSIPVFLLLLLLLQMRKPEAKSLNNLISCNVVKLSI